MLYALIAPFSTWCIRDDRSVSVCSRRRGKHINLVRDMVKLDLVSHPDTFSQARTIVRSYPPPIQEKTRVSSCNGLGHAQPLVPGGIAHVCLYMQLGPPQIVNQAHVLSSRISVYTVTAVLSATHNQPVCITVIPTPVVIVAPEEGCVGVFGLDAFEFCGPPFLF